MQDLGTPNSVSPRVPDITGRARLPASAVGTWHGLRLKGGRGSRVGCHQMPLLDNRSVVGRTVHACRKLCNHDL